MEWFITTVLVFSITLNLTDAECHCNTTTVCAVFPSTPCSQVSDPDSCQEGWFGSYCQRRNIALGRNATQSSTITENNANTGYTEHSYEARYAVDGRATNEFLSKPLTCTHTNTGDQQPTWTVYLSNSNTDKIQHVKLYLRQNSYGRNEGMKIYVGGQMCFQWSRNTQPPTVADVRCQKALTGNNLTIQTHAYLALCEVQIFVCSDGWFGEDCDKQCHCLLNTEVCDKITGQCLSGCAPGYMGTDCQTVCEDGSYGSGCASECGHCRNGTVCDKTNGICGCGCDKGYSGALCEQYAATSGCSNQAVPIGATLSTLLVLAVIALLISTLYIRRLKNQLEALQKKPEDNYISLDERTKDPVVENTYEHIDNTTPYVNMGEDHQGRI